MTHASHTAATILAIAGSASAQSKHIERPLLEAAPGQLRARDASAHNGRRGLVDSLAVGGIDSIDEPGAPGNTVRFINVGPGVAINGIGWDVDLEAFSPSWRSEIAVLITDSTGLGGFSLRPGSLDNTPGGPTNYNSGGAILHLANYSIPDVVALGDGLIRLEFFESYDDAPGEVDGRWVAGHLFFPRLDGADCPGDANFDRTANFADITSVLENWGMTYIQFGEGDADNNNTVNFNDITEVLENWGETCQ